MLNFDDWFADLCSNYVWYEPAKMKHKPETFKAIANAVYMQYVGAEKFPTIQDARVHVYRKVVLTPGDLPKVDWVKKAKEEIETKEKEKEWKPADPAHVDKCVEEFNRMLANAPIMSYKPPKKEIFYNGKSVEKIAPYPVTSLEEAYIKKRHFEYIKANYEPRTGHPLPTWIDERKWNKIYDAENKFPEL